MSHTLDTTAHPTGAPITATQDHVTSGSTSATGTFSTGGGNRVLVVELFADGGNAVWPATFSGAGLTWTLRASSISSAFLNKSGSAIYTAFAASAITSQSVTATFANAATGGANHITAISLLVTVSSGTPYSSDSALIGTTATTLNESTTAPMNLTLTPAGTGSWLFGLWAHTNNGVTPTADSNTSPFDFSFTPSGSDRAVFGRYMSGGSVATTTAGTPVTFGCSSSNTFYYMVALELMLPASAPLAASESGSSSLTGNLGLKAALAGTLSGGSTVANPTNGAVALAGVLSGGGASTSKLIEQVALQGSLAGSSAAVARAAFPAFPISVHLSGRYLVDANGKPFPIFNDSAWEAVHNLTFAEQVVLLNDRCSRGFTATLFPAIEHKFTASKPPKDLAGNLPFTLRLDGGSWTGSPNGTTTTNGNGVSSNPGGNTYAADPYVTMANEAPDLTTPNATYWATIDSWVSLCAQNGVACFIYPAYFGYQANDEGWNAEMVANDAVTGAGGQTGQSFADPTKSKLWNYGAWLANRYKSFGNIVWILGGDSGLNGTSSAGTFNTAQSNAVLHVYQGMHSVAGQASTNWTGHWGRTTLGSEISADATNGTALAAAMTMESTYPDVTGAQEGRRGWSAIAQPVFDIEDRYEGDEGALFNRRLHWWELLSGIAGYSWSAGNSSITSISYWGFAGSGTFQWQATLATVGTLDAQRLNAFWQSIPWWRLVPSGLSGMKTLVTSGGGTASPQSTDYVSAAATVAGDLLVLYVPPAHSGTVTVDMTAMAGPVRERWLDPTSNTFTAGSTNLANTGTHVFTTPGTNAGGQTDWTLVLDAAPLAGAIAGGSQLPASLTETVALRGVLAGGVAETAGLLAALQLQGVLSGGSSSTGSLGALVALAATAAGGTSWRSPLIEQVALAGGVAGQGAAAANLNTNGSVPLAGQLGGGGPMVANLTLQIALQGVLAGQEALPGALGIAVPLVGVIAGGGSSTAALSLALALRGSLAGAATLAGGLTSGAAPLAGTLSGGGALGGALRLAVQLRGSLSGLSALAGSIGQPVRLARGIPLRGQPTAFATLKGQAGFPVLWGQGDS